MNDEDLLTLGQLATFLQVPRQTIYAWRCRGEGPPGIKLGKHVRFRRRDVEKWLDVRGEADSRKHSRDSGSGRLR